MGGGKEGECDQRTLYKYLFVCFVVAAVVCVCVFFFFLILPGVSLCSSGFPEICYVDQAVIEFRVLPASAAMSYLSSVGNSFTRCFHLLNHKAYIFIK